jgi:hypothetical protein
MAEAPIRGNETGSPVVMVQTGQGDAPSEFGWIRSRALQPYGMLQATWPLAVRVSVASVAAAESGWLGGFRPGEGWTGAAHAASSAHRAAATHSLISD